MHFLTILEAEMSKIKCQEIQCLVRTLPGSKMSIFLLCPHVVWEVRELCGVSSSRALIPTWGFYPHKLITSQSPHLQIPSHWRLWVYIGILHGTNIQSIADTENQAEKFNFDVTSKRELLLKCLLVCPIQCDKVTRRTEIK